MEPTSRTHMLSGPPQTLLDSRKLSNCHPNIKHLSDFSFVRPKLGYSSIAYDRYTKPKIDNIERVLRKPVRFIYSKYLPSCQPCAVMATNDMHPFRHADSSHNFISLCCYWTMHWPLIHHRISLSYQLGALDITMLIFAPHFTRNDAFMYFSFHGQCFIATNHGNRIHC